MLDKFVTFIMIHTKIIYSYVYEVILHQRAFSNISV